VNCFRFCKRSTFCETLGLPDLKRQKDLLRILSCQMIGVIELNISDLTQSGCAHHARVKR